MKSFVAFVAILACAAAAPAPGGVLLASQPVVAVHSPVVHSVPLVGSKTTITKSSQVVNHGTPLHTVHSVVPVVHSAPIVHTAPIVHATPIVHASPVIVKTPVVAHSSSIIQHHSPIVKTVPLIAVHH